ncbi:hypothetical protein mru_1322 [Methanobrevibacter ruminantium M1]|uniref:Uncharacterized protein n=1 Tax=Methanobrevibacter ruminantium (strain ATCC 35063 / DSM 1093 / JCM 13430 / OCM 146 / M1) TaxID=634498 RepID=D3E3R1_METRM|nr:DUF5654 family protein [Methanobrevibacter ruminantium]ADC47172.1 hypothetical protein mru_1322 [Methanobrevibacter ruminantium M1]
MSDVGKTVITTIITLVTTAFGLVAGLAWNDAIQKLIDSVMGPGDALTGLFTYAVIVTILAVVVTIILARIAAKMGVELEE